MNVTHRQHLPPSGIEYACQASITPSTLKSISNVTSGKRRAKFITNLVVARSTLLHIFEVCLIGTAARSEGSVSEKKEYKLFHVCEHRLHGKVTGLQKIITLDSAGDGLDRLLISFEDAKMTLMEWSTMAADLVPVSLHTFEKLPQVTQGDLPRDYRSQLEVDPLSRCAVLLLPQATLAVLPFFQDHLDLDGMGMLAAPLSASATSQQRFQSFPYAPSFILDLNQQVLSHQPSATDSHQRPIKSVIATKFLPGFSEPTLAVLYQCHFTWSARLENGTDTNALLVLTLDLGSNHFPIISHTKHLPYDAHGIVACPKELGGILVICSDMILHVDQSSKIIGIATNGWANHTSQLKIPRQEIVELIRSQTQVDPSVRQESKVKVDLEDGEEKDDEGLQDSHEKLLVRLENSRVEFYQFDLALLFSRGGQVFRLEFERDGRTLLKLILKKFHARSITPSTIVRLDDRCLFVSSLNGDSCVYAMDDIGVSRSFEGVSSHQPTFDTTKVDVDVDMEDDIYGEHKEPTHPQGTLIQGANSVPDNDGRFGTANQISIFLRLCDVIRAHGSIRDFTMATTSSDNRALELLACTGAAELGGLTVFHREIPLRKRRQLSTVNISCAITRIYITTLFQKCSDGTEEQKRLLWITRQNHQTDVSSFSDSEEPIHMMTLSCTTVGAYPIFGGALAVQITSTCIKLLSPDLQEVQIVEPEPPVKFESATVMKDSVLLFTHCGGVLIYQGDAGSQSLQKLHFPSNYHQVRSASFLEADLTIRAPHSPDHERNTKNHENKEPQDDGMDFDPTSHAESLLSKEPVGIGEKHWLITTDSQGSCHIHALPTLKIVVTAKRLDTLPETLLEEQVSTNQSSPLDFFGLAETPSQPEPIAQIFGFVTGVLASRPHLAVMLRSGAFAVYELVNSPTSSYEAAGEQDSPSIVFKKVIGRQFEVPEDHESADMNVDVEPAELETHLETSCLRFMTSVAVPGQFRGAFLSAPKPVWLVSTDHGPCRIYESSEEHSVDSLAQLPDGFIVCSRQPDVENKTPESESTYQILWESFVSEFVCFDREIPSTLVKTGRPFNKVVFDPFTETVVASSYLETLFANFDEEGNSMWQPDDDSLIRPTTFRSSLELLLPGNWITIDGHEFQQNEWVTSMKIVDLDSRSTLHGRRTFIGVGTTCNRAEDLSARGGIYVFEVIFLVPDERHPERNRGLRLRYHEETKACVTAVDAINGYFLHTMGQKLYAKCFEQDERLLAVGFLDIKPYATCLRIFKNLILLGDAAKGLTMVAFQEEPYKLMELGHTYVDLKCSTVDILVIDAKMAIAATDLDGIIRIFEYNPTNIESQGGQKLLCRSEYHTPSEMAASMQFGKRASPKEEAKVVGTLYAGLDGSISSLVPTKEAVYKRLQLVQSRLNRHVPHFAGLNPRGFRTVRNDMVSRAINRGVLDGELLARFELLSIPQQREIAGLAVSDRETVLINLTNLRSLW